MVAFGEEYESYFILLSC